MKIKAVETWNADLGNLRPYTIAFKTVDEVRNVFVKVVLDNGMYGVGAGNPSQYVVGESIDQSIAVLESQSFDFLVGKEIEHMHQLAYTTQMLFPKNPAVRAAIDIALHDAFCKYLNVPLVKYLGQKIDSLPTSNTIGIKNVTETLAEAKDYIESGFTVLKVKLGKDLEEDIERMVKLREAHKDVVLRIDANQGYTFEQTVDFYNRTKSLNIELIEQPLKAAAVDEMRKFPDEIREVIAADESLISPQDAMDLAKPEPASGIYNIKLMKCGGVSPGQEIARIAYYNDIELFFGCNDESIVSITAALHLAYSSPNTKYIDLDGSLDLAKDAVTGGFELKDGRMYCLDKPGLGVELI